MLEHAVQKLTNYYLSKNRWWMPVAGGAAYSLALPPFSHETHWCFALFPLLNFAVLLPLFGCSTLPSRRRALLHAYLFGFAAALGQYHWLIFDRVEGLWHLVILGLFLASAAVAAIYLAAGMLFRFLEHRMPAATILIFPALWVLIDYCRSIGDLAFPWAFLGYSFTPVLPLAQVASVTGVWGLTFAAVLGNTLLWAYLKKKRARASGRRELAFLAVFALALAAAGAAGALRMHRYEKPAHPLLNISLLQPDIDQFHWSNRMLDTAFAINESLVLAASRNPCDLMILPESSLLCYLTHRQEYLERVRSWSRTTKVPLILGSLDWEYAPSRSPDDYLVYNAAFLFDTAFRDPAVYHKIRLVPFSEGMPFTGVLPLLSRVNLGGAGFRSGGSPTLFSIGNRIRAAPFICYESIFPGFVRSRVGRGADLMINITNDGWFGRSSGPRHHATMARLRAVECGRTLARCANSGISMFVDPLGRVLGQTGLYQRTILRAPVPLYSIQTLYLQHGDWFVALCMLPVAGGVLSFLFRKSGAKII